MDTKELEAKRDRLNEKIDKNNLDFSDPEIIKMSCELDNMVVSEMKKIAI